MTLLRRVERREGGERALMKLDEARNPRAGLRSLGAVSKYHRSHLIGSSLSLSITAGPIRELGRGDDPHDC